MRESFTIRRLISSLGFLSISVFIWISTSSFVFALSEAKIYWTDANNSGSAIAKVFRANLDGTNVEKLVIPPGLNPRGIALDVAGGKMYWADIGTIKRANLDGSNVE
ncbi:MAG TPA: hypothetical protein VLK23_09330, partial [Thermodesulfobacteriota bacterium]|nr:hypothetical protein [Thermodesulfobacteriota bacterium]